MVYFYLTKTPTPSNSSNTTTTTNNTTTEKQEHGLSEEFFYLRDLIQETDLSRRLHGGNVTMNGRADFVSQVGVVVVGVVLGGAFANFLSILKLFLIAHSKIMAF